MIEKYVGDLFYCTVYFSGLSFEFNYTNTLQEFFKIYFKLCGEICDILSVMKIFWDFFFFWVYIQEFLKKIFLIVLDVHLKSLIKILHCIALPHFIDSIFCALGKLISRGLNLLYAKRKVRLNI